MDITRPVALCRYSVKPGKESEFEALLKGHFPLLDRLGLVARGEPYSVFRGTTEAGRTYYVEVLPWKDEQASDRAHALGEIATVWNAMTELCDEMDFPHVERVQL